MARRFTYISKRSPLYYKIEREKEEAEKEVQALVQLPSRDLRNKTVHYLGELR